MTLKQQIIQGFDGSLHTLLGVGPMSVNCVEATIELSTYSRFPLMLIASRRQIDSSDHGGGYVNNWTTDHYANLIRSNPKANNIILARDHGGPWQNDIEISRNYSLSQAMASAKKSYEADIDSGFEIIHIDPSLPIDKSLSEDDVLDRVFELYEHCWAYACRAGRYICFEIGTEEQQSLGLNDLTRLEYQLSQVKKFCDSEKLPMPLFVVVQTGTKVLETENVGTFDHPVPVKGIIAPEIQIPKITATCEKFGVLLKQHNTDYLTDTALSMHPELGIHAANVAPEFGVAETQGFLAICRENHMEAIIEEFTRLAVDSKKWVKWMKPNGSVDDFNKAIICGHYLFATEAFITLKDRVKSELCKRGVDLDKQLKARIKASISRYLDYFNLRVE